MYSPSEVERIRASVGLVPGLASSEVRRRLKQSLRSEELHRRRVAFYLVEMEEHRLYLDAGCSSTVFFATVKLRLDERRARERLHLGHKLLALPSIDAAFCAGRLGWSKLLLLARVATPEHEAAWLDLALEVDYQALALEVKLAKEGQAPRALDGRKDLREVRFTHSAEVDELTHGLIEKAKEMLSAERGEPVGERYFLRIAAELVLSSEEDGTIPGRKRVNSSLYRLVLRPGEDHELLLDTAEGPIPVADDTVLPGTVLRNTVLCDAEVVVVEDEYPKNGKESASGPLAPKTPPKLREEILTRDGHRCRCCGRRRGLTVHHIRFRSEGGETRGANEITLCDRCHPLVHAGLLVLEGPDARHVRFVDRDGQPLHEPDDPVDGTVDGTVDAPELAHLDAPVAEVAVAEVPVAEEARRPEPVTLAQVPTAVDGAWWRRHADLVAFRKGKGLVFRPGTPLPEREGAETPDAGGETLDPSSAFRGLVGQDERVKMFRTLAKGSRAIGEPFPHTLFLGPAGTGKTTLARGVAALVGTRLHASTGPLLEDTHALVRILAGLEEGDVLFLDEIHAVPPPVQEVLYEALADRRLSLTLHEGARSRTVRLDLPGFTLLAATTEGGKLPDALKSRFLLREALGFYALDDLATLLEAQARTRGFTLFDLVARTLAWHARGTPREALRILECALRTVAGRGESGVDLDAMEETLADLGFDDVGLKEEERRYLGVIEDSSAPVPLHRIARELGSSPTEVQEDIEPALFRRGLVRMTPRGRVAV